MIFVEDKKQAGCSEISYESHKLIVVAGVASGAGKTSAAEAIIGYLSNRKVVAAGKITVTHGDRGCPHGSKSCNTCSSLGGDFQIITKPSIINQKGTDTARFAESGASKVVWSITKDVFIKDSWLEMKTSFDENVCVVIESNTLALIEKPALKIMVVDPTVSRKLWKPSAEKLIKESDVLIFNKRGISLQIDKTSLEVENLRGNLKDVFWVDHPHKVVEDERFLERLNGFITL